MSSSFSKVDSSPPQNIPHKTIQEITEKLSDLYKRLSDAKDEVKHASIPTSYDESKSIDTPNPLDKACNELNYLIRSFQKLEEFETDLSEPLNTLEKNVSDIIMDLGSIDSEKKLIERNFTVLRSNIFKVKVRIPVQHQAFSSASVSGARQYLQTTTASKEVGNLPNPYEADGIYLSRSFLKEFETRYDDLDTRKRLCLLCFAIFPENAEVKKRLLRSWWQGELLTKTKENVKFSVNETLKEFVEKGFIEPVSKKSRSETTSFKMHPIIRCLITRLAKKFNFFDYNHKGYPSIKFFKSKKLCLVKSEEPSLWFKNVPLPTMELDSKPNQEGKNPKEDEPKPNQQGKNSEEDDSKPKQQGKNLKEDDPKPKQQGKNLKKDDPKPDQPGKTNSKDEQLRIILERMRIKYLENLQTLFNVSKQFPDLPEELFPKMKNLGVLYLGRWEPTAERHIEVENTDFLKGLKNMSKLRFFSLQGISGISELPKSVAKLYNLRILDLRACHNLEKLPKEVRALKMLTYLDLSECYLLDNIPKQLSNLSDLKVLKGFVISKNSSCTLQHLTKLSKLEKLSINVNNDDFSIKEEGKSTIFSKFNSLKKLKISWGAGGEGAKSTNGNKAKSTPKEKGKKKVNGNNGAKSETPKSGVAKKVQKLTLWRGSSKSVPGNKVAATTANAGEVVKPQDENGDVKKQANDRTEGGQSKDVDNKGGKKQESGMKLVKLDLQCYPEKEPPGWLVPDTLTCLKRLYIRGGGLSDLGQILVDNGDKRWEVEILRLKYLTDIKIDWKELLIQFPHLKYLEKVKCPQIAFCPCDASGVWVSKKP